MYIDICIYMGIFVCVFLCIRGGADVPASTHGVNKCICVYALVQMYLCYLMFVVIDIGVNYDFVCVYVYECMYIYKRVYVSMYV